MSKHGSMRSDRSSGAFVAAFIIALTAVAGAAAQPVARNPAVGTRQTAAGAPHAADPLATDIDLALRWLPDDTESLIFTRGPLAPKRRPPAETVSDALQKANGPVLVQAEGAEFDPGPRDFQQCSLASHLAIFDIAGDKFAANLRSQPIRFALSAARRFGLVTRIPGGAPYEGCKLVVFERPVPDAPVDTTSVWGRTKHAMETLEGNRVVRIDTNEDWYDNSKCSVFIAKPKPQVLILATDRRFLATLLRRIASPPPTTKLFSPEPPEWSRLDRRASVWGVRHFRMTPLSANQMQQMGIVAIDFIREVAIVAKMQKGEVVGFSYSYEAQPRPNLTVRFVHDNKAMFLLEHLVGKDVGARAGCAKHRRGDGPNRS